MVGTLTIFVFKAQGSSQRDSIGECVPYNVKISKEENYLANVQWSTSEDCLGYIMYGESRTELGFIAVDQEQSSGRKHSVNIESLLPSKTYYFVIYSDDKEYGNRGLPLSFSLSSL